MVIKRAADRGGLLFAAGQMPRLRLEPRAQHREHVHDRRQGPDARAGAIAGDAEIFLDRHVREQFAPLRHQRDAEPDPVVRRAARSRRRRRTSSGRRPAGARRRWRARAWSCRRRWRRPARRSRLRSIVRSMWRTACNRPWRTSSLSTASRLMRCLRRDRR